MSVQRSLVRYISLHDYATIGTYNAVLSTKPGPLGIMAGEIRKYERKNLGRYFRYDDSMYPCYSRSQSRGNFLSGLGSKAELGRAGHVEDNELRLEEDVAVDGEPNAGVGLDTTEAGCETSLVFLYNACARIVGKGTYSFRWPGHS